MRNTRPGKIVDGIVHEPLGGNGRHDGDHRPMRQGRVQHVGFHIGNYLAPPPMFFSRDCREAGLIDRYRGAPVFLICGGPSFAAVDKEPLTRPGVMTMGYNNVVKVFRTNMWCSVDSPRNFLTSIWKDPRIEKFVPFDHSEKNIYDTQTKTPLPTLVGDCPNTWFYRRNEYFQADRFLFEDTINWGNHADWGGARTGMLAAIRILFLLGFRTIFLLGVDFKMDDQNKYCFPQDRHPGSISGNTKTYIEMVSRSTLLRSIFEKHGLNVYNCNPDSNLKVFDHIPYEEAIKICTNQVPDPALENTEGLYDQDDKHKKATPREQKAQADVAHGKKADVNPKAKVELPPPTMGLQEARTIKREVTDQLNAAKKRQAVLESQMIGNPSPSPQLMEELSLVTKEVKTSRAKREQYIAYCKKLEGQQ